MSNLKFVSETIKDILISVTPNYAEICFFEGYIYPNINSVALYFVDGYGNKSCNFQDENWRKKRDSLKSIMHKEYLNQDKIWNHFRASTRKNYGFKIEFAYIPEEDNWAGLTMKGISDLTEEEWKNTGIPKELWEERVRHKGTGTLGRPQSDFY